MNIYTYDIEEGDKGIIIASSENEAKELFKNEYTEIEVVDCYDGFHTCVIDKLTEMPSEPKLIYMFN